MTCDGANETGEQGRARSVVTSPAYNGTACPPLSERRACLEGGINLSPCPVDCKVTSWAPWTPCSVSCGAGGAQRRQRSVVTSPAHGGGRCPDLHADRPCLGVTLPPCPVDCRLSGWGNWSACSTSCGAGAQTRTRSVVGVALHGGAACPPPSSQGVRTGVRECEDGGGRTQAAVAPCAGGCGVSAWGTWSLCSISCVVNTTATGTTATGTTATGTGAAAAGTMFRTRTVERHPTTGEGCPTLFQAKPCYPPMCPVDCVVGAWGNWSACSVTCGEGRQHRARAVTTRRQHDGTPCPSLSATRPCSLPACYFPPDCAVSRWGSWGACSKTCEGGARHRSRSVVARAGSRVVNSSLTLHGKPCPPPRGLVDNSTCGGTIKCPVNCSWSEWSPWTDCNASCGVSNFFVCACLFCVQLLLLGVLGQILLMAHCQASCKMLSCNVVSCRVVLNWIGLNFIVLNLILFKWIFVDGIKRAAHRCSQRPIEFGRLSSRRSMGGLARVRVPSRGRARTARAPRTASTQRGRRGVTAR